jgi:hypothetical protein
MHMAAAQNRQAMEADAIMAFRNQVYGMQSLALMNMGVHKDAQGSQAASVKKSEVPQQHVTQRIIKVCHRHPDIIPLWVSESVSHVMRVTNCCPHNV